jgi:hypothetical protein
MDTDEELFCAHVGHQLAGLHGVEAVRFSGSRAAGTQRSDSDWDFAIYYRVPTSTLQASAPSSGQAKSSRSTAGVATDE